MCSACATMRPSRVEQRARAVAALLDVRGVAAADEHRAHLLGDAGERADEDRQRDRVERAAAHRALAARACRRRRPRRPAGPHDARRLGELDDRRAGDRVAGARARRPRDVRLAPRAVEVRRRAARAARGRPLAGRARARGFGDRRRCAISRSATSSTVVVRQLGSRSAARARRGSAPASAPSSSAGDGQLERLAAVAHVGEAPEHAGRSRSAARAALERGERRSSSPAVELAGGATNSGAT